MAYTLARSTPGSKLLARCEAGNASHPWSTGIVDLPAANLAVAVNGSGELEVTLSLGDVQRTLRFNDFSATGSMFQQLVFKATKSGGTNNTAFPRPVICVQDHTTGSEDLYLHYITIERAGDEQYGLYQLLAGAYTVLAGSPFVAPRKALNTLYRASTRAAGTSLRIFDFASGYTINTTAPNAISGRDGFDCYHGGAGTSVYTLTKRFVAPSEFTTVTGLSAGMTTEVQTAAGALLGTPGSESGGSATVDMFGIALETATKLVVKASGGAVLATYDAGALGEIIEPGETYVLSASSARIGSSRPHAGHRRQHARR
jgi:hypothetical protein